MADNTTKNQAGPFEEVTDPSEVSEVFKFALKQQVPITVWLKNKVLQFEIKLAVVNKERMFFDLPRDVSNDQWDRYFNSAAAGGESYLFGTVQIVKTIFFLKMVVDTREDRTIKLYKPLRIFKLQRRANMRIKLSFVKQHTLNVDDPQSPNHVLVYRMLDVSIGGTAVAAKLEEKERFKAGVKLKTIQFMVEGKLVSCDGIVKHAVDAKDESGAAILKVGIEFTNINSTNRSLIHEWVTQETRNIFSAL